MPARPRRRPAGSPTLTAIASAAGVTVPTVSKVLNGRSDVSDSVRHGVGDGYRSALAAGRLPTRPELIRHGDWSRAQAARQAARLLQLRHRPTAIFACSDLMALGVYDAAAAQGPQIPDDLSVVGFDDLVEARWLSPPLTTMRQPVRDMGAAATRVLLQLIDGERPDTQRMELATALVERHSTAPPP